MRQDRVRAATAALVVLPAAWGLVRIHPFELSYYNALIGGPRGAWDAGLELSYWYDACTPAVLADLNARLPCGAAISYANDLSNPVMAIQDLQALGALRGDLTLWDPATGRFPFMWLLTHDSKATAFTRLLFALRPWYALAPPQLDGLRVVTVADPVAVSRAWALQLLTTAPAPPPRPVPPAAPGWVRRCAPSLARLWGDGLTRVAPPPIAGDAFAWAAADPGGLRAAARALASGRPVGPDDLSARRLRALLARLDDPARGLDYSGLLLRARPAAVLDAAHILLTRPAAVRLVLRRYPYTDPKTLGGYLDRDL